MHPIKKIRQACFLACIESFLKDRGILRRQEEMIKMLRQKELCDDEGIVNRGTEKEVCLIFNIEFSDIEYHYPINPIFTDGSLLIAKTGAQKHCMRFFKQEEPSKIIVMNPEPKNDDFEYWNKDMVEEKDTNYHQIKLLPFPPTENS